MPTILIGPFLFQSYDGFPMLPDDILITESLGLVWVEGMMRILRTRSAVLIPTSFEVVYTEPEEREEGEEGESYTRIQAESVRVTSQFDKLVDVTRGRINMLQRMIANRIFGPKTLSKLNLLSTSLRNLEDYAIRWVRNAVQKKEAGILVTYDGWEERSLRTRVSNMGVPINAEHVLFACTCFNPLCRMQHAFYR